MNTTQAAPVPEAEISYFKAQSTWGVTKHMGGLDATDELIALCGIESGQTILDVGCGTGLTACYLARRYGCRVTGVDLSEGMVQWAEKRARRKAVDHLAQFRLADAQNLPFEDQAFDHVICESVTAFPPDKAKAVHEVARVTKVGGYVGLNEGTWLNENPPEDLVAYVKRTMAGAVFLPALGWQVLLEDAGLIEINVKTYKMSPFREILNELNGLDMQDSLDRLRGVGDFLRLYLRSPAFRRYARQIAPSSAVTRGLFAHLGYGLYVGKKMPAWWR